MAAIQNDRDLALQATIPRLIPILIPIDKVEGLPQALKSLRIKSTATTFTGDAVSTNPATITLTAEKLGGLVGTVDWSVVDGAGTVTPLGDSATVSGASVVGSAVTVRARVTVDTTNYDAQITLTKLGKLSEQDSVDLTTQVTGQLASGSVSGLGALALLNKVDLNTQTTGALDGTTQVTNLGTLAYANAIAADQIGAGTLAAGVIYAGTINADKINSGSFAGKTFTGGEFNGQKFYAVGSAGRIEIDSQANLGLRVYDAGGSRRLEILPNISGDSPQVLVTPPSGTTGYVSSGGKTGFYASGSTDVGFSTSGIQRGARFFASVTGVEISAPTHMLLTPVSSFPSPAPGGVVLHYTHGFCISDGTRWLKTTWNPV